MLYMSQMELVPLDDFMNKISLGLSHTYFVYIISMVVLQVQSKNVTPSSNDRKMPVCLLLRRLRKKHVEPGSN